MSYFDVWKKTINAENSNQAMVNNGKSLIDRTFKDDPSYKAATLWKLDLTKEPIDVRLKNIDRTTKERYFIFRPDTKIDVGSIVEYDNYKYVLMEVEENLLSPRAKGLNCNQTLNWKGLKEPIPCYADNSSYGVKGVIETNYMNLYDGKILFYTQLNEDTRKIRQDMRFLFNNDKNSVYEVVDINTVVTGNVLRIVMNKSEFIEGRDDVENNIAYNEWLDVETPTEPTQGTYGIKSSTGIMDINRWNTNTFTVLNELGIDDNGTWNISVDYGTTPSGYITIKEQGNNYIKITNNGYSGYEIGLTFDNGVISITQQVRLVR